MHVTYVLGYSLISLFAHNHYIYACISSAMSTGVDLYATCCTTLMMLIFQNRGLSAIINYPTVFHFFFIVIAYFDVLYFSLKPTSPLHSRNALPDPFSFHE